MMSKFKINKQKQNRTCKSFKLNPCPEYEPWSSADTIYMYIAMQIESYKRGSIYTRSFLVMALTFTEIH